MTQLRVIESEVVVPSANWCCHVIFNVAPEKFDMYSLGDWLKTTCNLEREPMIKDGRTEIVYFQRSAPAEPLSAIIIANRNAN